MLNIFMGFEQANRYVISEWSLCKDSREYVLRRCCPANEAGETLGYIAEEPRGFLSMFSRQVFRTHRPFRAIVMDSQGSPILWVCTHMIHLTLTLDYAERPLAP